LVNWIPRRLSYIRDVLFVDALTLSFYIILHALYNIKTIGLDNYKASPSTIIVINHKRDLDFPLITPILHIRKTFFHPRLRPCLVARDDMFKPGYFTSHASSTLFLGRLIHHWNPAAILHPLPTYPISHLGRKPLRALLYDIIDIEGNTQLRNVIKADSLQRFARMLELRQNFDLGSLSVKELLGYDYRTLHELPTDVDILLGELPHRVRTHSIEMINKQLHVLAHALDEGCTCLLAPEGNLWPDGHFWPIKSGLHRLLSMTKTKAKILPVNITCDFMTQRRMTIYITIGEEIFGARELSKMKLDTLIKTRIVGLGPVTMGQLGSDYILEILRDGKECFQKQAIAQCLLSHVVEMKQKGLNITDNLLNGQSFSTRLRHFLQYCIDQRILTKKSPDSYIVQRDNVLGKTGANYWPSPIQYSQNELLSLKEVYFGP